MIALLYDINAEGLYALKGGVDCNRAELSGGIDSYHIF